MASDAAFLGRGWSFPPRFFGAGAEVAMVSGVEDIHESLEIILTTYTGERVMRPKFGCALDRLLFEELDQSLANQITATITDAILYHEPRIVLDRVSVDDSTGTEGLLQIRLAYTVRSTNSRYNMVFPFYVNEATPPNP
ncbi:MAG: GPW/gp25 family protein [Myxococcales bacterium]|nr:GPW/gp25 family protein [Myxococcales bacterium]